MPLDESVHYWVARDGQTFGPYSAAEVRDYLRTGHIVPTDYLRGERDEDWTTVAAALGLAAAPPRPSVEGKVSSPTAAESTEMMYGVWGVVLGVLGIFCCGFFSAIPGLILSYWAMKSSVQKNNQLGIAGVVVNVIAILAGIASLCLLVPFLSQLSQMAKNMPGVVQ